MLSQAAVSEVYYSAEHAATNKNKETTKTDNSCLSVFQSPRLDSHSLFRWTELDKFEGVENPAGTLSSLASTVRIKRLAPVGLIYHQHIGTVR